MRPPGEIRLALFKAAEALATPEHGPTMRELAECAGVGYDAARRAIDNMTRAKQLKPVAQRRVTYRNRPVAEYAPWSATDVTSPDGFTPLLAAWGRV
jgi:hypothetical protein